MKARRSALAAIAILSANWTGIACAQSKDAAAAPVTTAVTVVAQRESVVTVVAPRETSTGMPTGKRQHNPVRFTKAVDADGDGLADAPAPAARETTSGQPSGKRTATTSAAAVTGEDCDDKDDRAACSSKNPLHKDSGQQGQNPLHGD